MFATKATLLGMEELVRGALWKGTNCQINDAIEHQSPRPKVLNEGSVLRGRAADYWSLTR